MSFGIFTVDKTLLPLIAYLVFVNIYLFFTMGVDKLKAKSKARRVPEARLFLLAILGGSLGGILGMYAFRHKTRHAMFRIGFPLIFAFHLGLALLIMYV